MKPDYLKHPDLVDRFWQVLPSALHAVSVSPAYEGVDATSAAIELTHTAIAEAILDDSALGGSIAKSLEDK